MLMMKGCRLDNITFFWKESEAIFRKCDCIHLAEKYLPEITFLKNTWPKLYIIQNINFPERALARNYLARKHIFQNLHLPQFKFGRNHISQKPNLQEFTLGKNYIWSKLQFLEDLFSRIHTCQQLI